MNTTSSDEELLKRNDQRPQPNTQRPTHNDMDQETRAWASRGGQWEAHDKVRTIQTTPKENTRRLSRQMGATEWSETWLKMQAARLEGWVWKPGSVAATSDGQPRA